MNVLLIVGTGICIVFYGFPSLILHIGQLSLSEPLYVSPSFLKIWAILSILGDPWVCFDCLFISHWKEVKSLNYHKFNLERPKRPLYTKPQLLDFTGQIMSDFIFSVLWVHESNSYSGNYTPITLTCHICPAPWSARLRHALTCTLNLLSLPSFFWLQADKTALKPEKDKSATGFMTLFALNQSSPPALEFWLLASVFLRRACLV